MADQEFKLLITGDASSAVQATEQAGKATKELKEDTGDLNSQMGVVNVTTDDVDKALSKAGETSEEAGEKVEQAGEKAGASGEKHRALRGILNELNRVSPGLGHAMELLTSAYTEAGVAAEGGAVGVAEFKVALQEMLVTLGPLIIAMLSVEAVMTYWDMYKEKVESAAKAQEAASERIVESTKAALEAVQALDEAMHPKEKNMAGKDEQDLKRQQEELQNGYNRQRELNKANEEKELQEAASPEEKEAIKKRFEMLDAQLNDWRDKQKAAIEGAMVATMEKQLADLSAANDKLINKAKPEYQMGLETGDMGRYNKTRDELKKNADEGKAIREHLDELTEQHEADAGNAAFNSETNQQVFGVKGQKYVAPGAGYEMPAANQPADDAANAFATGKSIADSAMGGGKVNEAQQQFLVVLEQSVTGHKLTFEQAARLIEMQTKNSELTTQLLGHAQGRIEACESRLRSLEGQMRNTGFNGH